MAEYIERKAVLYVLDEAVKTWKQDIGISKDEYLRIRYKNLPAADVRPVVRGKWIQRKNWTRCVCSACSWEITFATGNSYNYCPNCGADMREES